MKKIDKNEWDRDSSRESENNNEREDALILIENKRNLLEFVKNVNYTCKINTLLLLGIVGEDCEKIMIDLVKEKIIEVRRILFCEIELYALSSKGAKLMEVKKFNLNRLGLSSIEHTLRAQSETLLALKKFNLIHYEFEPIEFAKNSRPDAIWVYSNKRTGDETVIRLEIELTEKTNFNGAMDQFASKTFSEPTVVVFETQQMLDNYLNKFQKYWVHGVPDWQSCDNKMFKTGVIHKISVTQMSQVYFKLVGEEIQASQKLLHRVPIGMYFIDNDDDHFELDSEEDYLLKLRCKKMP
jgi:hypothetical protein